MLKMLLLIQLYSNGPLFPGAPDGYYFRQYEVLVRSEQECKEMGRDIVEGALKIVNPEVRARVTQTGVICSDATVELDFWPIPDPDKIPTPYIKMEYCQDIFNRGNNGESLSDEDIASLRYCSIPKE